MKVEKESLIQSLWDVHQIIKGVDFRKTFYLCSETQKKQFAHYYFLNRLFQYRRTRDPGLFTHVVNELSNRPEIIQKTIAYIRKLISDTTETYTDFFPYDEILDSGKNAHSHSWNSNQNTLIENNLYPLYYSAIERGDLDEAVIIRSQMTNKRQQYPFYCGDQFLDPNHNLDLKGSLASRGGGKWENEGRLFLTRNIKNLKNYQNPFSCERDVDLLKIFEYPIIQEFRESFEIYMETTDTVSTSTCIPRDLRFCRDCLFIAAEFWFDTLTTDQKIQLLNAEFTFKINSDKKEIFLSPYYSTQISSLLNFAHSGFVNESLQILEVIFTQSTNPKEQAEVTRICAECLKIHDRFAETLEYYRKSFNHKTEHLKILKSTPPKHSGKGSQLLHEIEVNQAIRELIYLLKEMGQVHVLQANFTGSEKCIDVALPLLDQFTLPEFKRTCIIEISRGYESCKKYDKELQVLLRYINKNPEFKEDGWIADRISTLKNNDLSTILKEYEDLSVDAFADKKSDLFYCANRSKNAFQYQNALLNVRKFVELDLTPENLFSSGILCNEMGYYRESHEFLNQIPRNALSGDEQLTLLRIDAENLIFSGEPVRGMQFFSQFFDLLVQMKDTLDKDQYALLQEREVTKVFNDLLENGLINGASVILPVIEDIKKDAGKRLDLKFDVFTDILSCSYQHIGWEERAVDEVMIALQSIDENTENYILFNYSIGVKYLQNGDYSKAFAWLERAATHPAGDTNPELRAMAMSKLADTYFHLGKFNEAKEFQIKAERCDPKTSDVFFHQGLQRISEFLSTKISIESIGNPDVKIIFKNAEKQFHENSFEIVQKNNEQKNDLSIILFMYGKGLESLLDAEVWSEVRQTMFQKYSDDGTSIDSDNYYTDLPYYFKKPLSMYPESRDSVSLGTWAKIDLKKKVSHPVVRDINKYLKKRFSGDFEIIRKACETISPYRNIGAHRQIITSSEEFLKKREEIIPLINDAIRVVHSRKTLIFK